MFIQQTKPPPLLPHQTFEEDNESLTDVSVMIRTKPSFINYNQTSEYYNTSIMHETHNQFIPDEELFQSLVAYADSFNLDGSIYSKEDIKSQLNSSSSIERTPSSTSHITLSTENDTLIRHNSSDESKSTTLVEEQDVTKLIPSNFFSDGKTTEENDKHSDESTTITDRSKFEWEYLSDTKDNSDKSSKPELFNYEATTDIDQLNFHYLHELERFSSMGFSQKTSSSSPIMVQKKKKKNKDVLIQYLHPPVPIIIREVVNKPFSHIQSERKHHLTPTPPSPPTFVEHRRSRKANINEKRTVSRRKQGKKIIIEYDQVNVMVDRNIKQRKDIKRVNPNQYIKQYGSSLYSNELFHNIVSNIMS